MNTKHSRSTDQRNLRNIDKDIVIIYIYVRFRKYLQLQFSQKPIKHSTKHPKSILPANSQINHLFTFFFFQALSPHGKPLWPKKIQGLSQAPLILWAPPSEFVHQ